MASGGYDRPRRRLSYTNIKEQKGEEPESEFVEVPRDFKGYVIGKKRCILHEIMQKSGARVDSQSRDEEGFIVYGDEVQRTCARRLIEQKVKDAKSTMWELVTVEEKYKGLVKGKQGAKLREINNKTRATVILHSVDGEFYIIRGTEEQRKHAKVQIGEIVIMQILCGGSAWFINRDELPGIATVGSIAREALWTSMCYSSRFN